MKARSGRMKARFKSVLKMDRKLMEEGNRQAAIVYGAACMALHSEWGWKRKRLESLFDYINSGVDECGRYITKKSILNMLEEETGIEMKLSEGGQSYHNIDYLNGSLGMYQIDKMSYAQIMAMRAGQIKWTKALIEASIFLALHRKSGFGAERIQRLLDQIFEIEGRYKGSSKAIIKACIEQTGIDPLKRSMERAG